MTDPPPPDLAAVKARQRGVWASGDYATVGAAIPIIAERLVDAADPPSGATVLDVAGGTGNGALAAARTRCRVTCTDYVPVLLEHARERAAAEGLEMEVREADAEDLPFADASFDMVMSVVGVMFAPDQRRAAGELLRVCRPGGTIALASWTPESFVGEMFRLVTAVAPPPPGLAPPMRWGTEEGVRGLLGEGVRSVAHERCVYTFRHPSAESFADFFLSRFGPVERAAAALDEGGRAAFRADIAALARTRNRRGHDGPVAIPASYLQTVAQRA